MSHSRWVFTAFGLLAAVSAGCGESAPKLYPASGTVTFEDKPVEGATVMFVPQQGAPCMGTTDASGKYSIATRGKPGVAAGTYNVTVSKLSGTGSAEAPAVPETAGGEPTDEEKLQFMQAQQKSQQGMIEGMRGAANPKALLPGKYAIPGGSGLHATVTGDATKDVFDFALVP